MKLIIFFVVIGFDYCFSYEAVEDNPGQREVARIAGQSYNDLGQVQIERDSELNIPNMGQFLLKIKDKKNKNGADPETTGGGHYTRSRPVGGNNEYDSAIFAIVKRIKNMGCTEKTSDCAIILGRYLRSDSKQSKSYFYQDKTLKRNTDSSPDYVNLDARYFANDY